MGSGGQWEQLVRDAFYSYGEIVSVKSIGGPRPFAFVDFATREAAELAANAGSIEVGGCPMNTRWASRGNQGSTGGGGGGPSKTVGGSGSGYIQQQTTAVNAVGYRPPPPPPPQTKPPVETAVKAKPEVTNSVPSAVAPGGFVPFLPSAAVLAAGQAARAGNKGGGKIMRASNRAGYQPYGSMSKDRLGANTER